MTLTSTRVCQHCTGTDHGVETVSIKVVAPAVDSCRVGPRAKVTR